MELYLVQHGEAKSEREDPERSLTEQGLVDVRRVARAAARMGLGISAVYHSGKLRAQQTAEILARELGLEGAPATLDGLGPKDDPGVAYQAIAGFTRPVVLVGHLPHLNRLTSLLVVGDGSRRIVTFQMGGMVCLTGHTDGSWRVRWALPPAALE